MPIYKPSELHAFLQQIGAHPLKQLSQNFLIDQNILKKTVRAAEVQPGDLVLEIGPGPGSLTEQLLAGGARVVAVEKDQRLAHALQRLRNADRQLDVYSEDIMEFPFQEALGKHLKPGEKAKLVANLPYHLTTPLLALCIPLHALFSSIVVMVQEEVARRFTAQPKTSEYSSFTLFLNYYSHPKYGFKVSRSCFYPSPSVDSAVVQFALKPPPSVSDEKAFFETTRAAFTQRRKMLRASLKLRYPAQLIEQALSQSGLDPCSRPEELSLMQFMQFFELIRQSASNSR